jgi:hypothetical protein
MNLMELTEYKRIADSLPAYDNDSSEAFETTRK